MEILRGGGGLSSYGMLLLNEVEKRYLELSYAMHAKRGEN